MIRKKYIETFDSIHASEELVWKVLNTTDDLDSNESRKIAFYKNSRHISVAGKIAIAAAAIIVAFGASNLITMASTGRAWILNVSDSLYDRVYERLDAMKPEKIEDTWKTVSNDQTETEDDLAAAGEAFAKQWMSELRGKCERALENGYVYQFEKVLKEDAYYGLIHAYNYIKTFTKEELEGAQINDDCDQMIIRGEKYHLMWSYYGDFKLDNNLPELPERSLILRVFSEENYAQWTEMKTTERLASSRERTARPIYEGRVGEYSNETREKVRDFTLEECRRMEISDSMHIVRLDGEYYVITYASDDGFKTTSEIRLYPFEGYKGDVTYMEKMDQNQYFTLSDFGFE